MKDEYHYHRPYCEKCKLIYSAQSIGILSNCSKCGSPLVFKSFNPWPKTVGGFVVLALGVFTLLIEVIPIIWIGGFIWGASLIYSSRKQWSEVKKLDKEINQKIKNNIKSWSKAQQKAKKEVAVNLYCPNCGAKIKESSNFCTKCGKKLKNDLSKL